jgi:hypothetical protein
MLQYCRCVMYNAAFITQLMDLEHPVVKVLHESSNLSYGTHHMQCLQKNAQFLNEEEGEISISELSQASCKATSHNSIEYMEKVWLQTGIKHTFTDNYRKRVYSHVKVHCKCSAVTALYMYNISHLTSQLLIFNLP